MPGVGYLVGGALVAVGSPRTAYAVAGAGVLALLAGTLFFRPSFVRRPAGASPTAKDEVRGNVPLPSSLSPAPQAPFEPSGRKTR
jgi:hypothetical protein